MMRKDLLVFGTLSAVSVGGIGYCSYAKHDVKRQINQTRTRLESDTPYCVEATRLNNKCFGEITPIEDKSHVRHRRQTPTSAETTMASAPCDTVELDNIALNTSACKKTIADGLVGAENRRRRAEIGLCLSVVSSIVFLYTFGSMVHSRTTADVLPLSSSQDSTNESGINPTREVALSTLSRRNHLGLP